ncbi:MAG TPA: FecR family protein, partial [Labilithrix sp.]|nr:FecR family protein [Labilithrix sp.]
MKSNRSLSDVAAGVLSAEARAPTDVPPKARAEAIGAIARAIEQRKRRQRFRRAGFGAAAVAATIVLAVAFGRTNHPQPTLAVSTPTPTAAASFVRGTPVIVRQGNRAALEEGAPLEAGDRLLVDTGSRTTVALSNGTYLQVEERADLVIRSSAPSMAFELASGSVRADVAKLKPNERFVIRTSDAEIEVHGTSFEVSRVEANPACGGGTTTRVTVREGIVAVRARGTESFVRANEVWPQGCAANANTPSIEGPSPNAPSSAASSSAAPFAARPRDTSVAPPSP